MLVRTERTLIRAAALSVRHVVVDIVAPRAAPKAERTPVNVAIVIDRSGSMGGEKIALAKAAAAQAIRLLRETDRFSVVTYDSDVDVVVPSTAATTEAVRSALVSLDKVEARGGTDLCGGWLRGCEQIAERLAAASIGRCLLLTDGQANVGITDDDEIARHVTALRARGVSTSTFGIGADFNAQLLQRMSDDGGGHFYYVESPTQIADFLTSELGETLEITARNVRIEIGAERLSDVRPITALRTERTGGVVSIHCGDLTSGQIVRTVVALTFKRGEVGDSVRVSFAAQGDGDGVAWMPVTAEWAYASHLTNDAQPRDVEVDRIVAEIYAQKARLEALAHNRGGDYGSAKRVLQSTAKRIAGYARGDAALSQIVADLEAEVLRFSRPMDAPSSHRYFAGGSAALRGRERSGRALRED